MERKRADESRREKGGAYEDVEEEGAEEEEEEEEEEEAIRLYKRVNDFVRSPFVGPVERLSRQTAKANAVSFYGVWSPFYGDRPPLPPALLAPGTLVASIGPIVSNLCICLIPPNVSSLTSFILFLQVVQFPNLANSLSLFLFSFLLSIFRIVQLSHSAKVNQSFKRRKFAKYTLETRNEHLLDSRDLPSRRDWEIQSPTGPITRWTTGLWRISCKPRANRSSIGEKTRVREQTDLVMRDSTDACKLIQIYIGARRRKTERVRRGSPRASPRWSATTVDSSDLHTPRGCGFIVAFSTERERERERCPNKRGPDSSAGRWGHPETSEEERESRSWSSGTRGYGPVTTRLPRHNGGRLCFTSGLRLCIMHRSPRFCAPSPRRDVPPRNRPETPAGKGSREGWPHLCDSTKSWEKPVSSRNLLLEGRSRVSSHTQIRSNVNEVWLRSSIYGRLIVERNP